MIAHHYKQVYNSTAHQWTWDINEILAIGEGDVRWSIDPKVMSDDFMDNPRYASNGRFVVNIHNTSGTFEMGISADGKVEYVTEVDYYTGYFPGATDPSGSVGYDVCWEPIDNTTKEVAAYAINTSTGEKIWRTTLAVTDNPNHEPPGSWHGQDAFVDGLGLIYMRGFEGERAFSLDPDGTIRWEMSSIGIIHHAYPDGGILASGSGSLKKLTPNGTVAWERDITISGSFPKLLVDENGTIYYSTGTAISAISHTGELSWRSWTIIGLAFADLTLVVYYLVIWRSGRRTA